jgi:hypothetical protein
VKLLQKKKKKRVLPSSKFRPDKKFYPEPSDDDPPEADEDFEHGVSRFQQIHHQASRARKLQEDDFEKNQSTYLSAIVDVEDPAKNTDQDDSGDNLFGDIDKAIALQRKEFVKNGLLKPNPKKEETEQVEGIEELEPEEVVDLEEID